VAPPGCTSKLPVGFLYASAGYPTLGPLNAGSHVHESVDPNPIDSISMGGLFPTGPGYSGYALAPDAVGLLDDTTEDMPASVGEASSYDHSEIVPEPNEVGLHFSRGLGYSDSGASSPDHESHPGGEIVSRAFDLCHP
jgi:hypothetical protein